MPNPKRNHVRYARRIPAHLVEKMDAYLKSIMSHPEHSKVVKRAISMTGESSKRMATYSAEQRQELEAEARSVVAGRDYSKNYLKGT